jgi:hypothetical protein
VLLRPHTAHTPEGRTTAKGPLRSARRATDISLLQAKPESRFTLGNSSIRSRYAESRPPPPPRARAPPRTKDRKLLQPASQQDSCMQANPSACQAARRAPPRSSRQACRQIPVHARRARRPPGAARPASPAELVAVALSPLSCSRESRTLPAAFLVVRSYCPHALVAAGSVEQALSNNMGGARLLPWKRRTAAALHSRGRGSGRKGRLMAKPWVMGECRPSPAWPGWASARM